MRGRWMPQARQRPVRRTGDDLQPGCYRATPATGRAMGLGSRNSPAISYPLRRSHVFGGALTTVLGVGLAAVVGWALQAPSAGVVLVAAGGCWFLAAAAVFHFWQGQCSGLLRWDGQSWTLEMGESPGFHPATPVASLQVLLDVQSHLWLSVQPSSGGRCVWLWLERSAHPGRWLDLRRAVYSPAKPGAETADENAPASSRGRES